METKLVFALTLSFGGTAIGLIAWHFFQTALTGPFN